MTKQSKFLIVLVIIVALAAGGIYWQLNKPTVEGPPELVKSQELLQGKIDKKDIFYSFTNDDIERFEANKFDNFVELKSSDTNYVYYENEMTVAEIFNSFEATKNLQANIGFYNKDYNCMKEVGDGFTTFNTKSNKIINANCPLLINTNQNVRLGGATQKFLSEREFEGLLRTATSGWTLIPTPRLDERLIDRITGDIETAKFSFWTYDPNSGEFVEFAKNPNPEMPFAWIETTLLSPVQTVSLTPQDTIVLELTNVQLTDEGEEKSTKVAGTVVSPSDSYFTFPAMLNTSQQITLLAAIMVHDQEGGSFVQLGRNELYYDPNNWVTFKFHLNDKTYVVTQDSPAALTPNEWHVIAGTYKDGEARLYIDGELENFRIINGELDNSGDMVIGAQGLNGKISDVRIFNTALTEQQIADLSGL